MQDGFRRIDQAGKEGNPMPADTPLLKYIGRH
jgi:hypothetical protein